MQTAIGCKLPLDANSRWMQTLIADLLPVLSACGGNANKGESLVMTQHVRNNEKNRGETWGQKGGKEKDQEVVQFDGHFCCHICVYGLSVSSELPPQEAPVLIAEKRERFCF